MSSYDATPVIAAAIKSEVAHPITSFRILPLSDEELALTIIDALESAGFLIVRRDGQPTG